MTAAALADHINQIGQALTGYTIPIAVAAVWGGATRIMKYLARANQ